MAVEQTGKQGFSEQNLQELGIGELDVVTGAYYVNPLHARDGVMINNYQLGLDKPYSTDNKGVAYKDNGMGLTSNGIRITHDRMFVRKSGMKIDN